MVIADEPTAAMDARAEDAVFTSLRALSTSSDGAPSRITVLITHRLANIRHADRIIVLDNELVARDGIYRKLFTLQAHAYVDKATPAHRDPAAS